MFVSHVKETDVPKLWFNANWLTETDVSIEVAVLENQYELILNICLCYEGWRPVSLYFKDEQQRFVCPACEVSHWDEESMICEKNTKLMNVVFEEIIENKAFSAWLAKG